MKGRIKMKKLLETFYTFKKQVIFTIIGGILIGAIPSGLPIHAHAISLDQDSEVENVFEHFEQILNSTIEIDMKDVPTLENAFSKDFNNNTFVIHSDQAALNLQDKTILEDEQGYFHLVVPIVSDDYNMLSNFTVMYDENYSLIGYAETLFFESENGYFKVSNFLNGNFVGETETDIVFIENEEFETQLYEFEELVTNPRARGAISCTAAVLGIGVVLAGLLVAACLSVCIATVGTGCAICMGGFVTIGGVAYAAVLRCWGL